MPSLPKLVKFSYILISKIVCFKLIRITSRLSQIIFQKRDNGCGADNECGFNEYCSGITAFGLLRGQCRTLLSDGSVCVRNEECLNICSSGRCTSCTQVKLIFCMTSFGTLMTMHYVIICSKR